MRQGGIRVNRTACQRSRYLRFEMSCPFIRLPIPVEEKDAPPPTMKLFEIKLTRTLNPMHVRFVAAQIERDDGLEFLVLDTDAFPERESLQEAAKNMCIMKLWQGLDFDIDDGDGGMKCPTELLEHIMNPVADAGTYVFTAMMRDLSAMTMKKNSGSTCLHIEQILWERDLCIVFRQEHPNVKLMDIFMRIAYDIAQKHGCESMELQDDAKLSIYGYSGSFYLTPWCLYTSGRSYYGKYGFEYKDIDIDLPERAPVDNVMPTLTRYVGQIKAGLSDPVTPDARRKELKECLATIYQHALKRLTGFNILDRAGQFRKCLSMTRVVNKGSSLVGTDWTSDLVSNAGLSSSATLGTRMYAQRRITSSAAACTELLQKLHVHPKTSIATTCKEARDAEDEGRRTRNAHWTLGELASDPASDPQGLEQVSLAALGELLAIHP